MSGRRGKLANPLELGQLLAQVLVGPQQVAHQQLQACHLRLQQQELAAAVFAFDAPITRPAGDLKVH
jgi:hypothetical protein